MNLLNIGWCKGYFNGRKKLLKLGLQCSVLRTGINPVSWIISRFDYTTAVLMNLLNIGVRVVQGLFQWPKKDTKIRFKMLFFEVWN